MTKAGRSLYQDAKYIIQYCKDSVTRARNSMQESDSLIHIGTSPMTPAQVLVDLWSTLQRYFPNIKFRLVPFDNTRGRYDRCFRATYRLGRNISGQAIELTEYFIANFSVNESRIYAAGYSAGVETMSRAVSMRPDLYAAYLHGASQWDGEFDSIAENGVAVYIFMAEDDEYYGSQKARDAYDELYDAYLNVGRSENEINQVLQILTPNAAWFAERGVTENYHGGGNVVFEETSILNWIISHSK